MCVNKESTLKELKKQGDISSQNKGKNYLLVKTLEPCNCICSVGYGGLYKNIAVNRIYSSWEKETSGSKTVQSVKYSLVGIQTASLHSALKA